MYEYECTLLNPTPNIHPFQMLGQFIARAIADHALPMDFLDQYKGKVDCEHARYVSVFLYRGLVHYVKCVFCIKNSESE